MKNLPKSYTRRRQFGRCLTYFINRPGGLSNAESRLWAAVTLGKVCKFGDALPKSPKAGKLIRADFLRFLLLGADENAPVREKGIKLQGAWITGELDLECAKVCSIWFRNCRFDNNIYARNAKCFDVDFTGCKLQSIDLSVAHIDGQAVFVNAEVNGNILFTDAKIDAALDCKQCCIHGFDELALRADRANIVGDVFLNEATIKGYVSFVGASIGGDFVCKGASFINRERVALGANGIRVKGNVWLSEAFSSDGQVCLIGARIGHDLNCKNGKFAHELGEKPSLEDNAAFRGDEARVSGTVFLIDGFRAKGEVRFVNATIGGDFSCIGGNFINVLPRKNENGKNCIPPRLEVALNLNGSTINRILYFHSDKGECVPVSLTGMLTLKGTHAHLLANSERCWNKQTSRLQRIKEIVCCESTGTELEIELDDFTYDRLVHGAPTRFAMRKKWLERQPDFSERFHPQPFEQLMKILRELGQDDEARSVGAQKETQRAKQARRDGRIWAWFRAGLWGCLCGHGYRPNRLLVYMALLWLVCGYIYQKGAEQGAFAPADAQVWTQAWLQNCTSKDCAGSGPNIQACADNWTRCSAVENIIPFNALVYSADVLLPVIDFKQRNTWSPKRQSFHVSGQDMPDFLLKLITWIENATGSMLVLLYGALISGLIKRE